MHYLPIKAPHVNRDSQEDIGAPLPCTGARLRRLTRRVTVFYEQHLRAAGVRLTQYSILAHLDRTPQPLTALAERLEMDRTSLTRGLRPLIESGWVSESRGEDARRHLFVLTSAGIAQRELAHEHWRVAQLALEDALERDFVAQLNQTLEDGLVRLKPALPEDN